jgi:hypothetical protein
MGWAERQLQLLLENIELEMAVYLVATLIAILVTYCGQPDHNYCDLSD